MPSISVITTNVFSGDNQIRVIAKNLGLQTCKDFEWIFVDAFYEENKQLVEELAAAHWLPDVIHVPICGATHVGRKFHWECYNNAVLLANTSAFLRLGVWRYFHHQVVEMAVEYAAKNTWVNLAQRYVEKMEDLHHDQIMEKYQVEVDTKVNWDKMICHCGMFSFSRQLMIDMNGNNEALLIHHWEDCDLNSRWEQLKGQKMVSFEKAFLRIDHSKSSYPYSKNEGSQVWLGKTVCDREINPKCLYYVSNNQKLEVYGKEEDMNPFEYRGFKWYKCNGCGTVAVSHDEKYFHFLKTDPRAFKAPINVGGVGRNLTTMNKDMKGLGLESKVELLRTSHTNPRFLQE